VIQEGTFNRVGDTETRKVDVRILAATKPRYRREAANGSSARTCSIAST